MSRVFRKPSVDKNELEIVKELRKVPGLSVEREKDDLFVGYKGVNYWYECKVSPKSEVKKTQYKLAKEWQGHYKFAFSARDILQDIGIERIKADRAVFNAVWHGIIRAGMTPAVANKYAVKAMERYKENDFGDKPEARPQDLIESMIEEAQK